MGKYITGQYGKELIRSWLFVGSYDGGWYARLLLCDGQGTCVQEGEQEATAGAAVNAMRYWAQQHGYRVVWTMGL